jgi:hypothetical protein
MGDAIFFFSSIFFWGALVLMFLDTAGEFPAVTADGADATPARL